MFGEKYCPHLLPEMSFRPKYPITRRFDIKMLMKQGKYANKYIDQHRIGSGGNLCQTQTL